LSETGIELGTWRLIPKIATDAGNVVPTDAVRDLVGMRVFILNLSNIWR
jgi:hypothetical protein